MKAHDVVVLGTLEGNVGAADRIDIGGNAKVVTLGLHGLIPQDEEENKRAALPIGSVSASDAADISFCKVEY